LTLCSGPSSGGAQAAAVNTAVCMRHRHFRWEQSLLVGKTKTGIVTIHVLNINDPARVMLRENLLFEGKFPPPD
jgi:hypothetical protein